jgi:hypothetical protein
VPDEQDEEIKRFAESVAFSHGLGHLKVESDGGDLFVVVDGRRIAKRGHPDTPEARTWIPIVPDVLAVVDETDSSIIIKYAGYRH